MSVHRCLGCHRYVREPYKRIGLSFVCSESCERDVRQRGGQAAATNRVPARGSTRDHLPPHIRDRIIARDGRCRYCGTVDNLHVHHIVYRSQGGGDEDTNLITLCLVHHDRVHSNKAVWQPVLEAYIETYYRTGRRWFLLALKASFATR